VATTDAPKKMLAALAANAAREAVAWPWRLGVEVGGADTCGI